MSKTPSHKEMVEAIVKKYGIPEAGRLIKLSDRSIRNYVDGKAIGQEPQRKIVAGYEKYVLQSDTQLTKESPGEEPGLKDKIIVLQNKIIKDKEEKEESIFQRLDEIGRDQQFLQETLDDGLRVIFDAVLGLKKANSTENLESIFRKKLLEIGRTRKQGGKID